MQSVLNVQCTGFKFFKKLVPTSLVKKLGLLVDFLLFNKYIFIIIFHGSPNFYEYTYLLTYFVLGEKLDEIKYPRPIFDISLVKSLLPPGRILGVRYRTTDE